MIIKRKKISHKVQVRLVSVLLIMVGFCEALAGSKNIISEMKERDWGIAVETDTINAAYDEAADWVKVDYEFGEAGWIALYPEESMGLLDVSGSDSISFSLTGGGYSNTLQLQIVDEDGNINAVSFEGVTGATERRDYAVPFDFLDRWEDDETGEYYDNVDKARISQVKLAVNPLDGRYGSVTVDSLRSAQVKTDYEFPVSSFERFGFPAQNVFEEEDSSAIFERKYCRVDPKIGKRCLKMNYNTGGGFGGYYFDFSGYPFKKHEYDKLKFYVKSDEEEKDFKVEIDYIVEGSTYAETVDKDIKEFDGFNEGTSTEWEEAVWVLQDIEEIPETSDIVEVVFVVDGTHEQSGTLYFDGIRFVSAEGPQDEDFEEVIYDKMNMPANISGWQNFGSEHTWNDLRSVRQNDKRALKLDYEFLGSEWDDENLPWVVMERDWGINLSTASLLSFDYRLENEKPLRLTLRVIDKNNTIYERRFHSISDTGGDFKRIKFKIDELSLFEKGEVGEHQFKDLHLTKINKFEFVIEGKEDEKGTIEIKNLAVSFEGDYEKERAGELIERVEVTNNPFSPNDDGIKDKTEFIFILSEDADVSLEIFSLNGNLVFDKDSERYFAGEKNSISFDGRDNSGSRLSNGMYIYKLDASGSGMSDHHKHVIGILR